MWCCILCVCSAVRVEKSSKCSGSTLFPVGGVVVFSLALAMIPQGNWEWI